MSDEEVDIRKLSPEELHKVTEAKARESAELVKQIAPMLHGRDPGVTGGALCDLLAMWLAGHPDFIREDMLAFHMCSVMELIGPNEKIIFSGGGHPQNIGTKETKQ